MEAGAISDSYPIFTSQDNLPLYNGFDFRLYSYGLGVGYGDGMGENHPAYRRGKSMSTLPYYNNVWIHVCGIMKSRTDMEIYVNGVNIGGEISGDSMLPMKSDFADDVARIGAWRSNGVNYFFKGWIDEVKVWNRALTASEVAASM
jgi:hypothetical protein